MTAAGLADGAALREDVPGRSGSAHAQHVWVAFTRARPALGRRPATCGTQASPRHVAYTSIARPRAARFTQAGSARGLRPEAPPTGGRHPATSRIRRPATCGTQAGSARGLRPETPPTGGRHPATSRTHPSPGHVRHAASAPPPPSPGHVRHAASGPPPPSPGRVSCAAFAQPRRDWRSQAELSPGRGRASTRGVT